ncbi:iron-containing alcohol dehydrogenase [Inquilinus limosus]|uniref:4-hydroxybutyrate dehydrogenase n=1 Tax=Inquilinus limosus TaxID=171674 RepID=A0A211ZM30_9PROT|nr:iron-containing alcohol dehydrogenase [Inquilinus limosus]OWJ66331.1 4-hydroxybutyrate dehydrogenase [Inquilinus limosus]
MADTITYLTTTRFGAGAVELLPQELAELGIGKPLLVTDPGIARLPLLDRVRRMLPAEHALFTETPGNPTEAAVDKAFEVFRQGACDGLVALGGGSAMDLAKAVALRATHAGQLAEYALIEGGAGRIGPVAPLVAIPTTAGTGSEVGRGALITLRDGRKLALISGHLIPARAICDPELTLGLPPLLTAATGMDALTHCIETFLSPRYNPPADAIALDGAARAMTFLPRAVADGGDREARAEMMMAALEGGLTFQKGLGAVHGLSHALGAIPDPVLHHGTLNAVILPAVLRFNAPAAAAKYPRLALAMGLAAEADLAAAIENLNVRLGLPGSLRQMGVTEAHRDRAVAGALADHSTASNARPVTRSDYEALFDAAMG